MRLYSVLITAGLLALCLNQHDVSRAEPDAEASASITFFESSHPRSLDPHRAGDVVSTLHCMHVYETLLEYSPWRQDELVPCLAASQPKYNRETRTYTFTLRDDVYFQDDACFPDGKGRKVTAADVVFSFKRLAALPDTGGFWVIEGQIVGLDAFREEALKTCKRVQHEDGYEELVVTDGWWKQLEKDVSGLRVVDERTFTIKLNETYPQLLHAITLSYGAVVAHEAARKYDLNTQAVGTGPYVLKEWGEEAISYSRNPNYRKVELKGVPGGSPLKPFEGKRLPLTDELHYEIELESDSAFEKFLAGKYSNSGLSKEDFDRVVDAEAWFKGIRDSRALLPKWREKGIELHSYAEPTLHYISFNMNDKTFGTPAGDKGRALRKAFAMCVDREKYIKDHLSGRGEAAQQLVPPGILARRDDCVMKNQRFDPEAARKLLKDAGFDVQQDGDEWITRPAAGQEQVKLMILHRSTREATKNYATFLQECGRNVGIRVENELMTFAEFLARQDEGTGQAYDAGWVMDYPDAQNMLQLLYGPNKPPGINSASYASEQYDRMYREMALLDDRVPTEAERKAELIVQMHKRLDEDTPWVLMEFRVIASLRWKGYTQADFNSFAYNHRKYAFWQR